MIGLIDRLARRVLRSFDPETAHALALKALRFAPAAAATADPRLRVHAFGLDFPNPVGIAAGFDKNAEAIDGMLASGCGFVEAGSVTPLPQAGNPRPRLFRLEADGAVINRMGFNNEGHAAARARMAARARHGGIVGINLGANKDTQDRAADYVAGVRCFAGIASYFAVNVSSPNTPGLRNLQQAQMLDDLLARVIDTRNAVAGAAAPTPVLVKIAPDLSLGDLDDLVAVARRRQVDGIIVSNTTISRPAGLWDGRHASESGGLSGRPLFSLSTRILAETYIRTENAFPLVGVGGIDSGAAAVAKIRAGATLLQLYSGLVYQGLSLIADINAALLEAIGTAQDLSGLVGTEAAARTAEPWPQ